MEEKVRKLKHRKALRQNILNAARKLFLEEGYKATSIRKIAAETDISPTTIYLYYKNKAEIVYALHQEGFELLAEQFKTLNNVEHSFERLKAMGHTYLEFAINHRGFYEIMFIMKEPIEHIKQEKDINNQCTEPGWKEGQQAFHALIDTVTECQRIGYFKGYDCNTLALLIWGNMHGLCTLNNDGRLELLADQTIDHINADEILQHTFDLYIKILESI